MLVCLGLNVFAQPKQVDQEKIKVLVDQMNEVWDISEEGTLHPKGTFPRKIDTIQIVALCSDTTTVKHLGKRVLNSNVYQRKLYVCNKPNSFTNLIYLDEDKKEITGLIIWQSKEIR